MREKQGLGPGNIPSGGDTVVVRQRITDLSFNRVAISAGVGLESD
ncbi:MAG: hypothetical protein PVJ33_00725 [Lysobacterales bacterium]|jgi:hypothetical protein